MLTGKDLLKKLNEMSEDELNKSFLWYLADEGTLDNMIDDFIFNHQNEVSEDIINETWNSIKSDKIAKIYKNVFDNMTDDAFNGFWDEFSGSLQNEIENLMKKELKKKGIKIIED